MQNDIAGSTESINLATAAAYLGSSTEIIKQIFLREKLIKLISKYRKTLSNFLETTCGNEIKNYLAHLPKEPLIHLYGVISGEDLCKDLSITKLNMALQDPVNGILFHGIINLAIRLGIGKIRASYTGTRTGWSRLEYYIIDPTALVHNYTKVAAWADYMVKIEYIINKDFKVLLAELKFTNHEDPLNCIIQGIANLDYFDEMIAEVNLINNCKLSEFLVNYWKDSVLLPENILVKKLEGKHLKIISEEIVEKVLTNNNIRCKQVREDVLQTYYKDYDFVLEKLEAYNEIILKYLIEAGLGQELSKLEELQWFNSIQFTNDLVDLPIIKHKKSVLFKYMGMVEDLEANIDLLFAEDLAKTVDPGKLNAFFPG